jgi:choline kinase
MKFQLEPVDVPWYSRRVIGLGKQLGRHWCHGESIGFQVVGDESFLALRDGLDALDDDERRKLYYEDVFARLVGDGHEFYTHAVQPEAWIEIDTIEDLEDARRQFGHPALRRA